MAKEIVCAFGTDVDSVAGWLGSYGGGDSPSDIQRGIFASEVGIIRLLRLFKKYKLKTTFFIPGHSIETFPNECRKVVEEGHEIGAHGYLHENPIAMTPTQEEAVLVKSIELIEKLRGDAVDGLIDKCIEPLRANVNHLWCCLAMSCCSTVLRERLRYPQCLLQHQYRRHRPHRRHLCQRQRQRHPAPPAADCAAAEPRAAGRR